MILTPSEVEALGLAMQVGSLVWELWLPKDRRLVTGLLYLAGVLVSLGAAVVSGDKMSMGIWSCCVLIAVANIRRNWRNRRRKHRLAGSGYKARLRLAAMQQKMRQLKPRPALQPVPQGA